MVLDSFRCIECEAVVAKPLLNAYSIPREEVRQIDEGLYCKDCYEAASHESPQEPETPTPVVLAEYKKQLEEEVAATMTRCEQMTAEMEVLTKQLERLRYALIGVDHYIERYGPKTPVGYTEITK